jgi:NAD-dependent dihydropyrimidine dehydrogenase PreA subunit
MLHINSAKCTGCGTCLEFCPQGAISLRDGKAEINQRNCIECGMCLQVCPAGAIYEVAGVPPAFAIDRRLAINQEGREVSKMRGRGWFGWGWPGWGGGFGMGYGRGFGFGRGWFGRGRGFGRRWWAMPYAGYYGATIPYMGYGYPYYGAAGAPYYTPYGAYPY